MFATSVLICDSCSCLEPVRKKIPISQATAISIALFIDMFVIAGLIAASVILAQHSGINAISTICTLSFLGFELLPIFCGFISCCLGSCCESTSSSSVEKDLSQAF